MLEMKQTLSEINIETQTGMIGICVANYSGTSQF